MKLSEINRVIVDIICDTEEERTQVIEILNNNGKRNVSRRDFDFEVCPIVVLYDDGDFQISSYKSDIFPLIPASDFITSNKK